MPNAIPDPNAPRWRTLLGTVERKGATVVRVVAAILVVALVSLVGVAAPALTAEDLPEAIANAKTPADHEAIAAYYDEEAKEAREVAKRHQQMGAAYEKAPPAPPKAGGGHVFHRNMTEHCDKVAAKYEESAKELEAMAAAHRAEAKAE
jgi:hypothetical protein